MWLVGGHSRAGAVMLIFTLVVFSCPADEQSAGLPTISAKLTSHHASISSLSFSSKGDWLASADVECNVVLWTPGSKRVFVQRLEEFQHSGRTGVSFNPANDNLAVFCKKYVAEFRQLENGEGFGGARPFSLSKNPSIKSTEYWTCRSIVFSRTGTTSAIGFTCGDRNFTGGLPDDTFPPDFVVASKQATFTVPRSVKEFLRSNDLRSLAFSPDGNFLAVGGRCRRGDEQGFVLMLELDDTIRQVSLAHGLLLCAEQVDCLAFSSDGKTLAAGKGLPIGSGKKPRSNLVVLNCETGKTIKEFYGCDGAVHALTFSPRTNQLFVGGGDSEVHVFTGERLGLAGTLHGHSNEVTALCFSEDGKTLASGGKDGLVILWVNK
jgi:WD40 repeat protein